MKAWISGRVALILAAVTAFVAVLIGFGVVFGAAILLDDLWPPPGLVLAFVVIMVLLRSRTQASDDFDGILDGAMSLVLDLVAIGALCGVAGGFLRFVIPAVL